MYEYNFDQSEAVDKKTPQLQTMVIDEWGIESHTHKPMVRQANFWVDNCDLSQLLVITNFFLVYSLFSIFLLEQCDLIHSRKYLNIENI